MSDYLVRVEEICNQADNLEDESESIKLLQKSFQLVKEVVNKTTLPNLNESKVDKILKKILDDKSLKKLEKILDAQTVEKYGAISEEINSNVKRMVYEFSKNSKKMVDEFFGNSKKMVGGDDVDECSICTENMGEGDFVRCPNQHKFHKHCIERWMVLNHTCPICRTDWDLPAEMLEKVRTAKLIYFGSFLIFWLFVAKLFLPEGAELELVGDIIRTIFILNVMCLGFVDDELTAFTICKFQSYIYSVITIVCTIYYYGIERNGDFLELRDHLMLRLNEIMRQLMEFNVTPRTEILDIHGGSNKPRRRKSCKRLKKSNRRRKSYRNRKTRRKVIKF
jgi:hypothetical protein